MPERVTKHKITLCITNQLKNRDSYTIFCHLESYMHCVFLNRHVQLKSEFNSSQCCSEFTENTSAFHFNQQKFSIPVRWSGGASPTLRPQVRPHLSRGTNPEKPAEAVVGCELNTVSQSIDDTDVMLISTGPSLPLNLIRNQGKLQEAAHLLAGSGFLTGISVQKTKDKTVGPIFKL